MNASSNPGMPGTLTRLLHRDNVGGEGVGQIGIPRERVPDTHIPVEGRKPGQFRVLTPLHSFEPGGVERIAIRLHRKWGADGVDSVLVMGRRHGPMREEFPGLTYQTIAPDWLPTARWETLWLILTLPAIIRRVRSDAIFCPGNTYAVVMVALKWLMGRDCPPVLCKISNDLRRSDLPLLLRWFYHKWLKIQAKHIDHFIALAAPMASEIQDLMHVPPDRVHIIEDPALSESDIGKRHPERSPFAGRKTHYLAIGRLAPQKNFALLLKAYATARMPDDRLTILGDGPQRAMLERLAGKLGIVSSVHFKGHVANIAPYLADADAFVLSSEYEGVPAVVLEALAAGLPIVATDCCTSMRSLIGNPAHGVIVPVGDSEALSDAMRHVRSVPFDQAAARCLLNNFTIDRAAPAYLSALKRMSQRRTA